MSNHRDTRIANAGAPGTGDARDPRSLEFRSAAAHQSDSLSGALSAPLPTPAPAAPLDRALLVTACLLAGSGPFWTTTVPGLPTTATVGLVTGVALAAVLLVTVVRRRPPLPRPTLAAVVFVAACVALVGWAWLNAAIWGRFVGGTVRGAVDVLAVALLLTAAAAVCAPGSRRTLVTATCLTSIVAAVLALTGTGPGDAAPGLPEVSGRLEGSYGNPNALGIAVALGIPVILALRHGRGRRARLLMAAAGAVLTLTLVATFSRAGLLGAILGCVAVVLAEQAHRLRRLSRRRLAIGLAVVAAAAAGAGLWLAVPLFHEARERVNFAGDEGGLDLSGWDPTDDRAFIDAGSSRMTNPAGGALRVETDAPGEGVSVGVGTALPSFTYSLAVRARSLSGPVELRYALGDDLLGNGPRTASSTVTGAPRDLVLDWRPTARSDQARLYVWQTAGAGVFELSRPRLVLRRSPGSAAVQTIPIPTQLKGPVTTPAEQERRFLRSREDALRLALETALDHPLRGIGLGRFTELSAQRLDYGPIATHNEYLRVAAELGLPGLALLLAAAGALAVAIRRVDDRDARAAAIGVALAAAAALALADALATASQVLPLAVMAGVVVGGWSARGEPRQPALEARDQLAGGP